MCLTSSMALPRCVLSERPAAPTARLLRTSCEWIGGVLVVCDRSLFPYPLPVVAVAWRAEGLRWRSARCLMCCVLLEA